jgi:peroxiredoxin
MKRYASFIVGALGALLAAVVLAAPPDLTLKDLDGKARRLDGFIGQGKWTVVAIWSADCPICKREIHHMAFFHDAHKGKDATVLGISVDGAAGLKKARTFAAEHGLNFPNLLAEPRQMNAFGFPFLGTPTYYIYSPQGELLARQVGPVTQQDIEEFMAARTDGRK